jgi:hypothetical protein
MAAESMICDGNFGKYFNENMRDLGLPEFGSGFNDFRTVTANIAAITLMIEKYGTKVTVLELIGAGLASEVLGVVGALGASAYLGMLVGSLFVASGRCLSGGAHIYDLLSYANSQGIELSPEVENLLRSYPGLWNKSVPNRSQYAGLLLSEQYPLRAHA